MFRKLIYLISFVLVLSVTGNASAELVGYWKFDEGAGTTAYDSSGNGLDGTLKGNPKWVAGYLGGALDFDGSDDYVEVSHNPILSITDEITIAAWTYMRANASGEMSIVSKGGWSANDLPYELTETPGGVIFWQFYDDGGRDTCAPDSPPVDEWHHIAGTYDGKIFKCYIDGVLADEWAYVGKMPVNTAPVNLGRRSRGGCLFNGIIDEVAIYDRALSEDEVPKIMLGVGGFGQASGPNPANGALHSDTWVSLSWRPGDFAVSHDVYLGENFDDVNAGAESTFQGNQSSTFFVAGFPGFAYPDGLVPGTTYYWRIDEVNNADPNSPWKGDVWSFSVPPKTAYNPVPADGAESVALDVKLSWTAGFGAKLHTVYFGDNFDDVSNAAGGLPQGAATYTPAPLKLAKTYYWRVDEFDAVATYKGNVWSFTTQGAVGSPNPSNGAVDVKQTQILKWVAGDSAASHQVYFGTDKEVVRNANTSSPEYKGTRNLGSESYEPGKLLWNATYYWRIDEVNNANPDSPWKGPLWSFTTANFLVVDDFEDYDVGNNEIWWSWKDGLGYAAHGKEPAYAGNGTGAAVGDESTGSYCEETIVHGGSQSMPLFYDNSVLKYSEAEKTLTYPRDWTENGVKTLTIWFRGDAANAAETLYVALNGSAVISHNNPKAAQVTTWTRWNIDLQAFADQGVNLANVNTIALGLGNKKNPQAGGSGTMYFDDIRLYRPAP